MNHTVQIISHIGVYGLIHNAKKNKILTIRKSRGPYNGKLDLPGGRPEGCESFMQTLRRELKEETNLDLLRAIQCITLLHTQNYKNALFRHTAIIYACDATGNVKLNPDGHDSDGCHWLEKKDICISNCSPLLLKLFKSR